MTQPQRKSFLLLSCFLVMLAGVLAASRRAIPRHSDDEINSTNPAPLKQTSITSQSPPIAAPASIGPIDRNVIAGGGGSSAGDSFRTDGTVGEVSASNTQSGGGFKLDGGFWNALGGTETSSPTPTPTPTPTATPTPTPIPTPTPTPSLTVVQFSASNFSVVEACTTLTISLNRVGDSSGAASVDYFTSDVTATERRNYITTIGTVHFAPGETAKNLAVLINQNSYVEGDKTFNVNLRNPSGVVLGSPQVTTVTIVDSSTDPSRNVIDDARNYVCQQYHDFLNRQPDSSGWDFWTNEINSCGADQQCIEVKRVNVSAAFFLSIEFQNTGYLVERMYKTAFGDANGSSALRNPPQLAVPIVRFRDFLNDTQQIGDGVVVLQTGWEQKLEQNKQAFAADFVQRSTFANALPVSMTPAQFVDRLNQNAGSVLSADERQTAINLFGGASDTSNAAARAGALRQIAEDADLNSMEFNRAFVLMQYFGYLRRNPNDPPDSDHTGYDFWLTKLNQFSGNYINAEMVKAFISSSEYRQRFGPS